MDNQTQDAELKAHLLATDGHYRELHEQHAQLKDQVEKMEAKTHLTADEELEEVRLKKLKLHLKDQMGGILDQYRHAHA